MSVSPHAGLQEFVIPAKAGIQTLSFSPQAEVLVRLREVLSGDCDALAFRLWRALLGVLIAANFTRYALKGWVNDLFIAPRIVFPYWGMEWVPRPSPSGVWTLVSLVIVGSLWMAFGPRPRVAALIAGFAFTWLELIDLTNYLNHYYLVVMLFALLALLPSEKNGRIPLLTLWTVRIQVGLVYFFAGIAKLRSDWLFEGQPLQTWFSRYADLPALGQLFSEPWAAHFASWFGFLFDISIVFFLLQRRTRPYAFAVAVLFHVVTGLLFPIGIFPWLMIGNAALFFSSEEIRKVIGVRFAEASQERVRHVRPFRTGLVAIHLMVQIALPWRQYFYERNPLWHEQGFRFSWCVMLMEKTGFLEYRVVQRDGREIVVHPRSDLTPLQMRMVTTQPDMIVHYAHVLAARFGEGTRVYADSFVALNGRRHQRFIDEAANLAQVDRNLREREYVLPLSE